jgi:hypothetical protein
MTEARTALKIIPSITGVDDFNWRIAARWVKNRA